MILLLNQQTVVFEVLNGIRLQCAKQLGVPVEWVEVRLERDKHIFSKATFHPVIELKLPSEEDPTAGELARELREQKAYRFYRLTPEQQKQELQALVSLAKGEIEARLKGLDE